jgi:phage-related protein
LVNVNYSLVGANGDEITFDYSEFILNQNFVGFGIPPAQVRIENSAGDGGVFRHSKRGVRDVDLPITVLGTDRNDVQTKLRRLSRLLQDTSGPTKIKATYSSGGSLTLDAHYVGGAESQWGSDAGLVWNKWVLSFQCPNPYWESDALEEFRVTTGNTGRGLLPQLSKLKVTSSQVYGVITVDNSGDVPAYPVWFIRGPISDVVISNGTQSFSFTEAVADGETITVNTETGQVTDDLGTNRYSILGPAPKLFRIDPGVSSISVNGVAATQAAEVRLDYSPLFEVVH